MVELEEGNSLVGLVLGHNIGRVGAITWGFWEYVGSL